MEKRDPYHSKELFESWLEKVSKTNKIEGINTVHSKLIIDYVKDMSLGLNISKVSKKGARSYIRLHTIRMRLTYLFKLLEKRQVKDIREVDAKVLHKLFSDMREGVLTTRTGQPFKSTRDYVKNFKAFWHWYIKIMRNKKKFVEDVTEDLDTRGEKPKFVYFNDKDCENIIENASYDLKPLLALAFDSGARNTELANVKVSDFSNDFKELNIRDETSKTFGRKIKLMMCSQQIKNYVEKLGLKNDDFLLRKSLFMVNKELRKLGKLILTPEQIKFKSLSLYDFRHSSACFWLPKYKSESALKYRFGWKRTDMIHYYTEFLGMKDTITQDDMYSEITKTELEKQLASQKEQFEKSESDKRIMQEKIQTMENQMKKIAEVTDLLSESSKKLKDYDLVPKNKNKRNRN
jgi:integrase